MMRNQNFGARGVTSPRPATPGNARDFKSVNRSLAGTLERRGDAFQKAIVFGTSEDGAPTISSDVPGATVGLEVDIGGNLVATETLPNGDKVVTTIEVVPSPMPVEPVE